MSSDSKLGNSNPTNTKEWNDKAKKLGVFNNSIHDLDEQKYASGSRIGQEQFLTLRVLWNMLGNKLDTQWLDDYAVQEATKFLSSQQDQQQASKFSTSWQNYLSDIRDQVPAGGSNKDIGLMSLVRYFQKSVQRHDKEEDVPSTPKFLRTTRNTNPNYVDSPPSASKNPPQKLKGIGVSDGQRSRSISPQSPTPVYAQIQAEDEQLVNSALLLFLISVTSYHPWLSNRSPGTPNWSLVRKSFQFGEKISKSKWTAVTDGYLRVGKDKVMGIIEVKPYSRTAVTQPKIQMQEAAQMAAWIYQRPQDYMSFGDKRRRLLVSQDAQDIYLTIAEYDSEYEEYLLGTNLQSTSFMTMLQYGPLNTLNSSHMKAVGVYILAFTLQQLRPTNPPPPAPPSLTSPYDGRQAPQPPTRGSSLPERRQQFAARENSTSDPVARVLFPESAGGSSDRRGASPASLRPAQGNKPSSRDSSKAPFSSSSSHGSGNQSRDASRARADSRGQLHVHQGPLSLPIRGNLLTESARVPPDGRQQSPTPSSYSQRGRTLDRAHPSQNPVLGGIGRERAEQYQGETSAAGPSSNTEQESPRRGWMNRLRRHPRPPQQDSRGGGRPPRP